MTICVHFIRRSSAISFPLLGFEGRTPLRPCIVPIRWNENPFSFLGTSSADPTERVPPGEHVVRGSAFRWPLGTPPPEGGTTNLVFVLNAQWRSPTSPR
jgi:hypothetical protein